MRKCLYLLAFLMVTGVGFETAQAQTLQSQPGVIVRPAKPRLQPNSGEIVRPGPAQPVQITIGDYVAEPTSINNGIGISAMQAWLDPQKRMVGGTIILQVQGRNGSRDLPLGLSPLSATQTIASFVTVSNDQRAYRNFVGLEVVLMPETGAVKYEIRSQGVSLGAGTLVAALPGASPSPVSPAKPWKPKYRPQGEGVVNKEVGGEFNPKPSKPIQGTFVPLRPPQPNEPRPDLPPSPGRPNRY